MDRQVGLDVLYGRSLLKERRPLLLQLADLLCALLLVEDALDEQTRCTIQFPVDCGQPPVELLDHTDLAPCEPTTFIGIHLQEALDGCATAKGAPQPGRDPSLDLVEVEVAMVVAGSALLRPGADQPSPPVITILDRKATTAASAFQQAGEEVLWPAPLGMRPAGPVSFPALGSVKLLWSKDGKVGGGSGHPLCGVVYARHATSCIRILYHSNPVPDVSTAVDRIDQDTVASCGIAVQGRGGPQGAAWRRHAVIVETLRNFARRQAGQILLEDAPNDGGLGLNDLELTRVAELRPISVGTSASVAAISYDAVHAAVDLVLEVLEVERADKSTNPNLRLVGLAVMNAVNFDAVEAEALVYSSEVLLIARDAIQGLDDHDVEVTRTRARHHGVQSVSSNG